MPVDGRGDPATAAGGRSRGHRFWRRPRAMACETRAWNPPYSLSPTSEPKREGRKATVHSPADLRVGLSRKLSPRGIVTLPGEAFWFA